MEILENLLTGKGSQVGYAVRTFRLAGDSREEVLQLIRVAIELHIEGFKEEGCAPPLPHSSSELIGITA